MLEPDDKITVIFPMNDDSVENIYNSFELIMIDTIIASQ